ncbi:MAG: hypothetical protein U1E53_13085 [Dongiaceae bacterium]
MATGFLGLPTALELSRDSPRRIATVVNGILAGKTNNVATVTCTAGATTTVVSDPRIGLGSAMPLEATTANAAAELATDSLAVEQASRPRP